VTRKPRQCGGHRVADAAALSMLLLIGSAGRAEPQTTQAPDGQAAYRVSVDVNLVVLNASVRDKTGRAVDDLRKQNFEVYEDGIRQSIRLFGYEDLPVTVGLIVDHSGSMRAKMPEVIAAARAFAQASSPQDEMFVVNFSDHVMLGLPDAVLFSNHPDQLALAISTAPAAGMTALYDAVIVAQERLRAGSRDKKVLIMISDGGDNASIHSVNEALQGAARSNALIYTIGIFDETDPEQNPHLLKRLAQISGGEAFFPRELNDLIRTCERIAHDIRHQYTLGYVSNYASKPGVYHTLRVVARATDRRKLLVRARSGYIGGGEPPLAREKAAK
jgi:Ca-activated chloride channel homolog